MELILVSTCFAILKMICSNSLSSLSFIPKNTLVKIFDLQNIIELLLFDCFDSLGVQLFSPAMGIKVNSNGTE